MIEVDLRLGITSTVDLEISKEVSRVLPRLTERACATA
jgi:hypothetical protein